MIIFYYYLLFYFLNHCISFILSLWKKEEERKIVDFMAVGLTWRLKEGTHKVKEPSCNFLKIISRSMKFL